MRALFILLITTLPLAAQTRGSAHYSISAETVNSAGTAASSGHFQAQSQAGTISAVSSSEAGLSKAGFLGQIYDVTGLTLTAVQATVAENGTRQLLPLLTLDDATLLAVPAASATWSVLDGPVDVSTSGLASGETIAAADTALVRASYLGFTADLNLSVLNVNTDDFGTYAADGIADDWQVQYFGEDNPLAAPTLDPDGDGQSNNFEFTAGLSPLDAQSRFLQTMQNVPGQPAQMRLQIAPRLTDRTYVIESSPTLGLSANWQPLTSFTTSDAGNVRTITDLSATGAAKFYRVRITGP
jgi:hypothetical protein